jgi:hypothetical protein
LSKIVFISINYQIPMYAEWEKVSTKIVNRFFKSPPAPDLFKRSFFSLDFPACRLPDGIQGRQVGSSLTTDDRF